MNTPAKPSLPNDWPSAQRSGILSPERIAEIDAQVAARTKPLISQGGTLIENTYTLRYPDEKHYAVFVTDYMTIERQQDSLIAALLTPDELAAIKADSGRAYSEYREAERFVKATKILDTEYAGTVFWGDTWYRTVEEAIDAIVCNAGNADGEIPDYLWAGEERQVIPSLSVSDVVDHWVDDRGWEDMDIDDLEGVSDLRAALDAFVAANAGVHSYTENTSLAVILSAETRAEIFREIGSAN